MLQSSAKLPLFGIFCKKTVLILILGKDSAVVTAYAENVDMLLFAREIQNHLASSHRQAKKQILDFDKSLGHKTLTRS